MIAVLGVTENVQCTLNTERIHEQVFVIWIGCLPETKEIKNMVK